jgi:hypothetical protein
VSGVAHARDRHRIRQLYEPDWKAWFGKDDTDDGEAAS